MILQSFPTDGVPILLEYEWEERGDVTNSHRIWTRNDTGCFVPSPAIANGKVYILRDRGEVHCIDPKTGKANGKMHSPEPVPVIMDPQPLPEIYSMHPEKMGSY